MFRFTRRKNNRLSYRILFSVLICSSILTLLASGVQLYVDYQKDLNKIASNFSFIKESYLPSITSSVYKLDNEQIQTLMNGVLKIEDIIFLEIYDINSKIYTFAGDSSARQDLTHSYPLVFQTLSGTMVPVGSFFVYSSLDGIYSRLFDKALIILLTNMGKAFFASILILFIIQYLSTRHLKAMADFANQISPTKLNDPLVLSRKTSQPSQFDELDQVVVALNDMQARIFSEITERKQADNRYKKTVDISIDGFWAVDRMGKVLDVNHAYCSMSGFTKNELLRMSISDVEANQSAEEIKKKISNIIRDGSALFESQHRHKNGGLIDVEVSTTYSADDDTFFTFIRDIGQRKEAEKLEKRLQQIQKMEAIGTLAGGIAHDFNNILGAIIGYTEMAKDDTTLGSQIENDLQNVLISANRAKELVKQILVFSREAQVKRFPLKLQLLIKEGIKMLRSSIPTTIIITEDSDPRCGTVLADPTQVHQILMNLCTNAYHAMESTGGELSVTLNSTVIKPDNQKMLLHLTPGDYVELTVRDTGAGIGPDVIGKIFDPYYTTKETGKGTGLGLAIIHGIMNECGGAITVESQLGEGSTFHVYFPAVTGDALPEIKEQEGIPRGKERVLFIDDEAILAQMGKEMLERLGYHVTVRHTSFEAMETFQNTPDKFDLVITDQTMPGMTGADLARRMLQIRPDIPIILCTGYSSLIDEFSAKAMGIKEFLLKPMSKEMVAKLIRKVLDNNQI